MTGLSNFKYAEFASRSLPGFRNRTVTVEELSVLQRRHGYTDCYSSCFLFDEQLAEYVHNNNGSVAGYAGPCYAHYLFFDLDGEDLAQVLHTGRALYRFALDRWGAPEVGLASYFSGNGLHVAFATRLFGIGEASVALPGVTQYLRRALAKEAQLKHPEVVDFGVGDRLRLLRLVNTRHTTAGRYKIPLLLHELLNSGPDEIREMAASPRRSVATDATGLVPAYEVTPIPAAEAMYQECRESFLERQQGQLPDPATFLSPGDVSNFLCEAERRLYEQGVARGARSKTAVRLASRMRAADYDEEEAARTVVTWNQRNRPPLDIKEARRIVRVAYQAEYQFGCGTGDTSWTSEIPEACPYSDRSQCRTYAAFQAQRKHQEEKG